MRTSVWGSPSSVAAVHRRNTSLQHATFSDHVASVLHCCIITTNVLLPPVPPSLLIMLRPCCIVTSFIESPPVLASPRNLSCQEHYLTDGPHCIIFQYIQTHYQPPNTGEIKIMTVKNDEINQTLVHQAASVLANQYRCAILHEHVTVLHYDPDHDIIFIKFQRLDHYTTYRNDPPTPLGLPPLYCAIDVEHQKATDMECRCRPCGRIFVPTSGAVMSEHEQNLSSYGKADVADTLNNLEYCSECSGASDDQEITVQPPTKGSNS